MALPIGVVVSTAVAVVGLVVAASACERARRYLRREAVTRSVIQHGLVAMAEREIKAQPGRDPALAATEAEIRAFFKPLRARLNRSRSSAA